MSHYPERTGGAERDETAAERLDRNWADLLQELRVTQTGIQILSGFLLILPFQARFDAVTPALLAVYICAVVFGTLAAGLMIAPVSAHRLFFGLHVKDRLVVWGNAVAKAGLLCFSVTIGLVVGLVFAITLGDDIGTVAGIVAFLVFALLWVALPFVVVRASGHHERRGT
jgi:hypothetical protein